MLPLASNVIYSILKWVLLWVYGTSLFMLSCECFVWLECWCPLFKYTHLRWNKESLPNKYSDYVLVACLITNGISIFDGVYFWVDVIQCRNFILVALFFPMPFYLICNYYTLCTSPSYRIIVSSLFWFAIEMEDSPWRDLMFPSASIMWKFLLFLCKELVLYCSVFLLLLKDSQSSDLLMFWGA